MKRSAHVVMLLFFASNCLGIIFLAFQTQKFASHTRKLQQSSPPEPISYTFLDIEKAHQILSQLDQYKSPRNNTFLDSLSYISEYRPFHYGLTEDKLYCQKHRLYFVNDPEYIFEQPRIFSDFDRDSIIRRKVIPAVGKDMQRKIGPHMKRSEKMGYNFDIDLDASAFFCGSLYTARRIGKHFSCLTQMSNHIPGHVLLTRKDYQSEALKEYVREFQDMPTCFDSNKYFPKAWTLNERSQCQDFFNVLKDQSYEEAKKKNGIVLIKRPGTKSNVLDGTQLVDQEYEEKLQEMYKNGKLCGQVQNNYVIEKFISNPLLVKDKRFILKSFMLIASSNPMIVFYHDGLTKISDKKYQKNEIGNINATRDSNIWTLEELENHLVESGKISGDAKWLENYLRPELKRAMIHLIRFTQFSLQQVSSLYELFEVEFMMDENLNVWFIEADGFPEFQTTNRKESRFLENMLTDHFEIMNGLLRSRVKRIIQYVNMIIKNEEYDENIVVKDVHQKREEFLDITMNKFEPEFEPRSENKFSKIVDENFDDDAMYNNYLPHDCFEFDS